MTINEQIEFVNEFNQKVKEEVAKGNLSFDFSNEENLVAFKKFYDTNKPLITLEENAENMLDFTQKFLRKEIILSRTVGDFILRELASFYGQSMEEFSQHIDLNRNSMQARHFTHLTQKTCVFLLDETLGTNIPEELYVFVDSSITDDEDFPHYLVAFKVTDFTHWKISYLIVAILHSLTKNAKFGLNGPSDATLQLVTDAISVGKETFDTAEIDTFVEEVDKLDFSILSSEDIVQVASYVKEAMENNASEGFMNEDYEVLEPVVDSLKNLENQED